MARAANDANSTVEFVESGCLVCHHGEAGWTAANAVAVAAQHHRKTGHLTWARQTVVSHFGGPTDTTTPVPRLPGM